MKELSLACYRGKGQVFTESMEWARVWLTIFLALVLQGVSGEVFITWGDNLIPMRWLLVFGGSSFSSVKNVLESKATASWGQWLESLRCPFHMAWSRYYKNCPLNIHANLFSWCPQVFAFYFYLRRKKDKQWNRVSKQISLDHYNSWIHRVLSFNSSEYKIVWYLIQYLLNPFFALFFQCCPLVFSYCLNTLPV